MVVQETSQHLPAVLVNVGAFIAWCFSQSWMTLIVVPVLLTFAAKNLKAHSRPIGKQPGDEVLGFDLALTACVTLLISGLFLVKQSQTNPARATESEYYLMGLFGALILFALVSVGAALSMRYRGWTPGDHGTYTLKWKWTWSINFLGAFLLLVAFVLSGGQFR